MHKIIDNFIDDSNFNMLYQHIVSANMNWFLQPETTRGTKDEPFFSHTFYQGMKPVSPLYDRAIFSILKNLNAASVYNARANLYYNIGKPVRSSKHIDVEYNNTVGKTSILYINTNNGLTILYPKNSSPITIESVANRLLTFDSNIFHEAQWQTDTKTRIVINFNYIEETEISRNISYG
tara:strand:+ start:155 stop:691 length:537 start_codon:yes stop_codon:yes gene_type:complete